MQAVTFRLENSDREATEKTPALGPGRHPPSPQHLPSLSVSLGPSSAHPALEGLGMVQYRCSRLKGLVMVHPYRTGQI